MSKKIEAVDIVDELPNEEDKSDDVIEEKPKEETKDEPIIETTPKSADDEKITEIINEEEKPKPKPSRKMITCPDCGKTMLEKNFRYQHIEVCGKVRKPKLRAKPIEEVIKDKREKAKPIETQQPIIQKADTQPELTETPKVVDYWTFRREYANRLKERKQQLAKRLVSAAF